MHSKTWIKAARAILLPFYRYAGPHRDVGSSRLQQTYVLPHTSSMRVDALPPYSDAVSCSWSAVICIIVRLDPRANADRPHQSQWTCMLHVAPLQSCSVRFDLPPPSVGRESTTSSSLTPTPSLVPQHTRKWIQGWADLPRPGESRSTVMDGQNLTPRISYYP